MVLASSGDFLTAANLQLGGSATWFGGLGSGSESIRSGNQHLTGTATLTGIIISTNMVGKELTLKYHWQAGYCLTYGEGSAPSLNVYVGLRKTYARDFVLDPDYPTNATCGGSITTYSPDPSEATFQLSPADVGQQLKLELIARERNLHVRIYEVSVEEDAPPSTSLGTPDNHGAASFVQEVNTTTNLVLDTPTFSYQTRMSLRTFGVGAKTVPYLRGGSPCSRPIATDTLTGNATGICDPSGLYYRDIVCHDNLNEENGYHCFCGLLARLEKRETDVFFDGFGTSLREPGYEWCEKIDYCTGWDLAVYAGGGLANDTHRPCSEVVALTNGVWVDSVCTPIEPVWIETTAANYTSPYRCDCGYGAVLRSHPWSHGTVALRGRPACAPDACAQFNGLRTWEMADQFPPCGGHADTAEPELLVLNFTCTSLAVSGMLPPASPGVSFDEKVYNCSCPWPYLLRSWPVTDPSAVRRGQPHCWLQPSACEPNNAFDTWISSQRLGPCGEPAAGLCVPQWFNTTFPYRCECSFGYRVYYYPNAPSEPLSPANERLRGLPYCDTDVSVGDQGPGLPLPCSAEEAGYNCFDERAEAVPKPGSSVRVVMARRGRSLYNPLATLTSGYSGVGRFSVDGRAPYDGVVVDGSEFVEGGYEYYLHEAGVDASIPDFWALYGTSSLDPSTLSNDLFSTPTDGVFARYTRSATVAGAAPAASGASSPSSLTVFIRNGDWRVSALPVNSTHSCRVAGPQAFACQCESGFSPDLRDDAMFGLTSGELSLENFQRRPFCQLDGCSEAAKELCRERDDDGQDVGNRCRSVGANSHTCFCQSPGYELKTNGGLQTCEPVDLCASDPCGKNGLGRCETRTRCHEVVGGGGKTCRRVYDCLDCGPGAGRRKNQSIMVSIIHIDGFFQVQSRPRDPQIVVYHGFLQHVLLITCCLIMLYIAHDRRRSVSPSYEASRNWWVRRDYGGQVVRDLSIPKIPVCCTGGGAVRLCRDCASRTTGSRFCRKTVGGRQPWRQRKMIH